MRKKSSNFIPVLEDYFTTYLTYSRGLSVNTINSYKQCFLLLLTFMREKKGKDPDEVSFADLGYDTLQEFLRWLETERDCTAATRNQRLSA
ncbi:MAG: site-specific integrase, partial [Lachnospiraceae bacterium]|nr:site-specific integrase [Lachnospiraceae bacterium]